MPRFSCLTSVSSSATRAGPGSFRRMNVDRLQCIGYSNSCTVHHPATAALTSVTKTSFMSTWLVL